MPIEFKDLVPIAQVLGTFIAAASLFFAAYQLRRTVQTNRRQTNSQIFLDCVKRYEKIVESFPVEAWLLRFDEKKMPAPDPAITQASLRYLNLCSEEFYLRKRDYFDEKIALIWDDLLKRSLRSALFKREWPLLKQEFASDAEFTNYVESIQMT